MLLYFWWGCRRNLKLIILASERVEVTSKSVIIRSGSVNGTRVIGCQCVCSPVNISLPPLRFWGKQRARKSPTNPPPLTPPLPPPPCLFLTRASSLRALLIKPSGEPGQAKWAFPISRSSDRTSSGGLSGGAIAGIVITVLLLVALAVVAVVWFRMKRGRMEMFKHQSFENPVHFSSKTYDLDG